METHEKYKNPREIQREVSRFMKKVASEQKL